MTTLSFNNFNTEELKRKLDSDDSQGGPQKLLKRSSADHLSDIFSQSQFLPFEDEDDEEFDDEMNDSINEDSINQQQQEELQPEQQQQQNEQEQKQQQPTPPQRKKPGRKPNPASPALRKAQNRAAQRAFRERKERHLRELENTIKTLRENQYESLMKFQREYSHYRSLIEQLEAENSFLKEIAFTFECALNNINGNNEATTKMKNAVSLSIPTRTSVPSSLPLNGNGGGIIGSLTTSPFGLGTMQMRQTSLPSQQSVPTAQQLQNTYLGLLQPQVNGRNSSNINITSPATSNIMMSPNDISTTSVSTSSSPQTPESVIPGSISPSSTFFAEEFAREISLADMKTFVSPTSSLQINHEGSSSLFADGNTNNTFNNSTNSSIFKGIGSSHIMSKSDSSASSTISSSSNNSSTTSVNNNHNNNISYMAEAATMIDNDADYFSAFIFNDDNMTSFDEESNPLFSNLDFNNNNNNNNNTLNDLSTSEQNITKKRLSKVNDQILRLSKKIGQTVPAVVIPKTRYALTPNQLYYLSLEHDPRIDLIPCLHLRSRMIQYQGQYDLYELVELLIKKAKCHGEPCDPMSWELPEEFFERYGVLVFQQCRVKSSLYKKYGRLPKDFDNFFRKGSYMIS
ncbi:hypothetical protein C1645_761823 [Glomus cerebriforme]|uniref:BZIP domain-containing protein n=1 Tax=Glomus cerebriforme TaxID=658196 RepID=A0A397TB77_9GLOM|nr:hypothetical protein C1645_761823 [Glomus cerebriforme]